jgi:transposase
MEELFERCCGLDVHRDTVVATVMVGSGKSMIKETKTFGTMTHDLNQLSKWLKEYHIKHVALESTGVYWKPIFNILEEDFEIILANARRIKNVPGRKTDVKDSEWICKLLKNGLIEKSFIPPESIRYLRDLTRYRRSLSQDLGAAKNRLLKFFESVNIKVSSVFTDVYGKTAWGIIQAIVRGETSVEKLTEHIPAQVKKSKEEIRKALTGTLKDYQESY